MNNGGDVLARGGRRATYRASENVTQEHWDKIWDGWEPSDSAVKVEDKRASAVEAVKSRPRK